MIYTYIGFQIHNQNRSNDLSGGNRCHRGYFSLLLMRQSSSEFIFNLNCSNHILAFYQFQKGKKEKKKILIRVILSAFPVGQTIFSYFFFFCFLWKDRFVLNKIFFDSKKIQFVLKGKRLTPLAVAVCSFADKSHCGDSDLVQRAQISVVISSWS